MKKIRKIYNFIILAIMTLGFMQNCAFANTFSVPYTTRSNLMLIEAKVNGHKGKFLVDSGASYCVLYKNFVEKNNIPINTRYAVTTRVANGELVQNKVLKGTLTLGTRRYSSVQFLVAPTNNYEFDGLIGGNILNKMNYKIDKKKQKIMFIIN